MSPEELMKSRWKVIGDWPSRIKTMYNIGDILYDDGVSCVRDQNGNALFADDWNKYPHLFKKLEWWEERTRQDLTGYIKLFLNGRYIVYQTDILDKEMMKWQFGERRLSEFQPATQSEYTTYLQSRETMSHYNVTAQQVVLDAIICLLADFNDEDTFNNDAFITKDGRTIFANKEAIKDALGVIMDAFGYQVK